MVSYVGSLSYKSTNFLERTKGETDEDGDMGVTWDGLGGDSSRSTVMKVEHFF